MLTSGVLDRIQNHYSKTEDHKGKRGRTERGRRRDLNEFIEV